MVRELAHILQNIRHSVNSTVSSSQRLFVSSFTNYIGTAPFLPTDTIAMSATALSKIPSIFWIILMERNVS